MENRKGGYELDSTHQEQMQVIGEMLRKKRKEMNLSLREAENATSIRVSYLQSLEEADTTKLISPVYAQGFFKQYATFLGLDGEHIVREYPKLFNRHEDHEFAYGIGTLEVRGHPGAGVKWFPNAMWFAAFVIVLVSAWFFARYLGVL